MIKTKYILIILLFATFGCEKVIDVDLNEAHPEVVIEANLSKFPDSAKVKLSKTGSYFGESTNDKISDAIVVVTSNYGESYIFNEVEEGVYKSFEIIPEEGVVYSLTVETEGETYEANSILQATVPIDSLTYYYYEGFAFLDAGYVLKLIIKDPAEIENYYRIKIYESDRLENVSDDFIVFDDRLVDGKLLEITLRGNLFEVGDTVTVQLMSIDNDAYKYFDTFHELININPGSAAPANPTSNISNGALGYFSVWSSDVKTVIIKE